MRCATVFLRLFACLLSATLYAAPLAAQERQVYFTGLWAPLGSLSSAGATKGAVYLRWDVTEGDMPDEITGFRLERDGADLAEIPRSPVMDAAAIGALYAPASQQRRRREMRAWLARLHADMEPDDPCRMPAVTAATLGEAIFRRIDPAGACYDRFWAQQAARLDPNVARARRLAWVDDAVPAGDHLYRLYGRLAGGGERLLGEARVRAGGPFSPLPAAGGFRQVMVGRCDAPEGYKDHGVVSLTWDLPGSTVTDKMAASLLIAGYDIYRTTDNLPASATAPLPRDLRKEAALLDPAADGSLPLAGLERVNDQPIAAGGEAAAEERYQGWNPPFAQFQELAAEVASAGLRPGDRRAYYLVGRDFTGNYTATAAAVVTVPDRQPPPAPWGVEARADTVAGAMQLTWEQITRDGWLRRFGRNRQVCASDGQQVCHTAGQAACGPDAPVICVDLQVSAYLVYRFDDPAAAAAFSDTDGDGVADGDERQVLPGAGRGLARSLPGTACDPAAAPAGAANHLVARIDPATAVTLDSGRQVLRFSDPQVAANKNKVFWYRLASQDAAGNVSPLSAPVRGFFPDRTRPAGRPLCSDRQGTGCIGLEGWKCSYGVKSYADARPRLAEDLTGGDAAWAVFRCQSRDLKAGVREVCREIVPVAEQDKLDGRRGAWVPAGICAMSDDLVSVSVAFLGRDTELLAEADVGAPGALCATPPALVKDCSARTSLEPWPWGAVLVPPVWARVGLGPDECASLYRWIGGRRYRVATVCGKDDPTGTFTLDTTLLPSLGGDDICLSVDVADADDQVSDTTNIPCFKFALPGNLEAPTPLDLVFDDTDPANPQAGISWLPPQQPAAGVLVDFYQTGDSGSRTTTYVAHAGRLAADGSAAATLATTPHAADEGSWQEEWCFRVRAVGYAPDGEGLLSDWSPPLCRERRHDGKDPEYLAWPEIPEPPFLGPLAARFLPAAGYPVILMSDEVSLSCTNPDGLPPCDPAPMPETSTTAPPYCNLDARGGQQGGVAGDCDLCANLLAAGAGSMRFVAYRQSRPPGGQATDFVQVSPRVDTVFCDDRGGTEILEDPFFSLVQFTGSAAVAPWNGTRLLFVDRYPFVAGHALRYQLVYFDEQGEIMGYRATGWLATE